MQTYPYLAMTTKRQSDEPSVVSPHGGRFLERRADEVPRRPRSALRFLFLLASCFVHLEPARAACVPPPAGLIGWWSGDGNAYDIQGVHNGVPVNGVSFVPGKVGRSFRFDGVEDHVDLGTWNPGPRWSLEAWVNPSATPTGRHTIVGGFGECLDWGLTLQDGKFALSIKPPGGCTQSLTNAVNAVPGTWYHLVGVCDGTNATLFINAEPKTSGSVETNYVGTSAGVRIGGEACCAGTNFPGLVDEVAIYDRALSAAEIAAQFAAGDAGRCKPEITAPVGYVQWAGNGHWYRAESAGPGGIDWTDAEARAEASGGYLAAINNEDENAFVYSLVR